MGPSVIPEPLEGDIPLVVDLDGTLIHTDLVLESLMLLAKHRPWRLFAALSWLFGGIALFKQKLAQEVMPDIVASGFDGKHSFEDAISPGNGAFLVPSPSLPG